MASITYHVTIGDRVLLVTLRRGGERLFARVGEGEEVPVQFDLDGPTLRSVALGPRQVELLAQRAAEEVRVVVGGLEYRAQVVDEAQARLAAAAGAQRGPQGRRELKAPMPGLVVKLLCAVGDRVGPGQPLVVLQAMKMENELSLDVEGTVTAIPARAGGTVDQGQVLVTLE